MSNPIELSKLSESTYEGRYIASAVSKDGAKLRILDTHQSSSFEMKVATFRNGLKEGKYTLHSDESFDIEGASSTTEWA